MERNAVPTDPGNRAQARLVELGVFYTLRVPIPEATRTLTGSLAGDPEAKRRLMQLVYDDLRALASADLGRERIGHTLQPTALVHEAFLRLIEQDRVDLRGRTHFFAVAALTMRRVLVDHARSRLAAKRGGGSRTQSVPGDMAQVWEDPGQLIDLDLALERLARAHPRQAQVVEMRFFAGMSLEEVGMSLDVSRETVKLDWRFARAWLARELDATVEGGNDSAPVDGELDP